MSGNPTNVVPMPTNWPGQMFPGARGAPTSPSCFSQLAALNACYDSVQMMEQILAKVMTDLVTNDPAVQKAIVEAIAASGSNVPLIGVTNGSNAQPGQVGEFLIQDNTVTMASGSQTQTISSLVLPPGDWDVWTWAFPNTFVTVLTYTLSPTPAGFSNSMIGNWFGSTAEGVLVASPTTRASVSVPTLLAFSMTTASPAAGSVLFQVEARRVR